MANVKINGIVIAENNMGDYDKMLTNYMRTRHRYGIQLSAICPTERLTFNDEKTATSESWSFFSSALRTIYVRRIHRGRNIEFVYARCGGA